MAEEAVSDGSRAREVLGEVVAWRVPVWVLVVVVLVCGAFVLGTSTTGDAGEAGAAGAGAVEVLDGEATATSCTAVLAAADAFVDAGEGNGEIYVAVDPETGAWAVELTPDEERCGLRYREVIDRLSSASTGPDEPGS